MKSVLQYDNREIVKIKLIVLKMAFFSPDLCHIHKLVSITIHISHHITSINWPYFFDNKGHSMLNKSRHLFQKTAGCLAWCVHEKQIKLNLTWYFFRAQAFVVAAKT